MAVLHFSQGNLNRCHQTRRPSRLARPGFWNEPDPFGVSKGIVLTGILRLQMPWSVSLLTLPPAPALRGPNG